MADSNVVTIYEERSDDSRLTVWGRRRGDGSVVIEGQDLGAGARQFWGAGEYEWVMVVPPNNVPALAQALGGRPSDEVLDLLGQVHGYRAWRSWLDDQGIPYEFWSRVGD